MDNNHRTGRDRRTPFRRYARSSFSPSTWSVQTPHGPMTGITSEFRVSLTTVTVTTVEFEEFL